MARIAGRGLLLLVFLLGFTIALPVWAQYTDWTAYNDLGGGPEFARRRAELAKQVGKGYVVLFARTRLPEASHYREDNDFFYFTGISDPGAVMLLSCPGGQMSLLEPDLDKRTAGVYGANVLAMPEEERKKYGLGRVMPAKYLNMALANFAQQGELELWVRMYPDSADQARSELLFATTVTQNPLAPDPEEQAIPRRLAQLYPTARLHDVSPLIDAMRAIKTPGEIAVLRRNGKLSAAGIKSAMARAYPGIYEYQVEAEASRVFRDGGAEGVAYPAIVGSGPNVNTWHYFLNRRKTEANDLVVFDYAADLDHLAMDITRTFSVSGKFTPEQAKWYQVDLDCQKSMIALLKPGNTYEQAAEACKKVFENAGIGNQARPYGAIGHFVGLATHDVGMPMGPVKAGQVVTVEPIIEFADKHIHIRIEDTVLITENGPEVLTADVPKEMAEVEKLVGSEKH